MSGTWPEWDAELDKAMTYALLKCHALGHQFMNSGR